eukprot:TRINITY_DN25888_c0_g1_i6.p1 TRINITY_DN25888_c0_g1~~TRINITY_DN25888_c0_g1_i6.p1  ORF type:complete len:146 (-),score=22.92 TRINITY_DN25888_c0_g1_i6:395-832(-)
MSALDVDSSYCALGSPNDADESSFWEDEGPMFESNWQRFGVCILCTVLTLYFIPMLSFIPLVIFGGVNLPSPFEQGYNNATSTQHFVPEDRMPSGSWYWDLPTVTCCVLFGPATLLYIAYTIKMKMITAGSSSEALMQENRLEEM